MPTDEPTGDPPSKSRAPRAGEKGHAEKRPLPPAAERALAEAAARLAERNRVRNEPLKEVGGPGGPEPTRYGDWEINGLASDF